MGEVEALQFQRIHIDELDDDVEESDDVRAPERNPVDFAPAFKTTTSAFERCKNGRTRSSPLRIRSQVHTAAAMIQRALDLHLEWTTTERRPGERQQTPPSSPAASHPASPTKPSEALRRRDPPPYQPLDASARPRVASWSPRLSRRRPMPADGGREGLPSTTRVATGTTTRARSRRWRWSSSSASTVSGATTVRRRGPRATAERISTDGLREDDAPWLCDGLREGTRPALPTLQQSAETVVVSP